MLNQRMDSTNSKTKKYGGSLPDLASLMQQSREEFELVLQEVCIQHRDVESIKAELAKTTSQEFGREIHHQFDMVRQEPPPKVMQHA